MQSETNPKNAKIRARYFDNISKPQWKRIHKKQSNGTSPWWLIMVTGLIVTVSAWNTWEYRSATRDENRAYLSLSIATDTLHRFSATVYITNVGKTPAYHVHHYWDFKITSEGVFQPDFDKIKEDNAFNTDFVPQNITYSYPLNSSIKLSAGTADTLLHWKGKGLYYFGRFTYDDKFGHPHFLDYSALSHPSICGFKFIGVLNRTDN